MLPTQNIEGILVPDFSLLSAPKWEECLADAFSRAEIEGEAISDNLDVPDFENTFMAIERRTKHIWSVQAPFMAVQNAHNTPEMQALAKTWLPKFKDLENRFMTTALAERCRMAMERDTNLDAIDQRLCKETIKCFERSGAFLIGKDHARFLEVSNELSMCGLEFAETHQANSNLTILVDGQLPGVDALFADGARKRAFDEGHTGKAAISMNASEADMVLAQCSDLNTRRIVWEAFAGRGQGLREGDTSTQPLMERILMLRQETAYLLGFTHWDALATHERMAKTPEAANALVQQTWDNLLPVLLKDEETVLSHAHSQGFEGELEPWDVDYWLAETRAAHFAVDEEQVRRHLPLPIVRAGAFATAETLFGVSFEPVDAPTYHVDATPFLVRDTNGQVLGLLYIDDTIRDTKSSGAWMEMLLPADRIDGGTLPIISNVCNFPSASRDRPALLSMDEAVTAFHELGHALHGLLTTARYPSQSGTMVAGDFVELQSQLLENWIREPEALSRIALDWETGQKLDIELAKQVDRALQFGQSFDKSRYLMSAWLDLSAHKNPHDAARDPIAFEQSVVYSMNAPPHITPRHRLPHFTHLFAGATGGEYSAGYYSYLWAEVLEADAFEAWTENGNLFDEELGRKARNTLYARGNEIAPDELYRQFRGRDPDPNALLRRMGAHATTPKASSSLKR